MAPGPRPSARRQRPRPLSLLRPREHGFLTLTLAVILVGVVFAPNRGVAFYLAAALALLGLPLREVLRGWLLRRVPGDLLVWVAVPVVTVTIALLWIHRGAVYPLGVLAGIMALDLLAVRYRWYRRLALELAETTGLVVLLWLLLHAGGVAPAQVVHLAWGFGVFLELAVILARALRVQRETQAFHLLWLVVWGLSGLLSFWWLPWQAAGFLVLWTLQMGTLACVAFRGQTGPRAFRRLGWFLTVETVLFGLLWGSFV